MVIKLANSLLITNAVAATYCYPVVGRLHGILWRVLARSVDPTANRAVSTLRVISNDLHARYTR